MKQRRFWTPTTIRILVVLFTVCMLAEEGWQNTEAFYVVILGIWFAVKILEQEHR